MNIMLMYAILMLGKCHPVHSKILISLSILVTIGLSLGFAFGMSHYLGYPMTQMSLMTIFVLIGVGVDDMFILVDAGSMRVLQIIPRGCTRKSSASTISRW